MLNHTNRILVVGDVMLDRYWKGTAARLSPEAPVPVVNVAGIETLKSSKAPTNYFTPNILRKSWSRLVVSVVHLDALAFPVAAT